MNEKYLYAYMKTARIFGDLSTAWRKKVGAVIVKNHRIISIGYNGMPAGWTNECEYKEYDLSKDIEGNYFPGSRSLYPHDDEFGRYMLKTKPEVLHAESNAIAKLAKTVESGDGATMFVTCAPCIDCAKMIYQSGISQVYFNEEYRNSAGLDFLHKCGVETNMIQIKE